MPYVLGAAGSGFQCNCCSGAGTERQVLLCWSPSGRRVLQTQSESIGTNTWRVRKSDVLEMKCSTGARYHLDVKMHRGLTQGHLPK